MTWFQTAQAEMQTFFDVHGEISEEDNQNRGIAAIDGFHDLFMELMLELKIKEDWPTPHCHIHPFSTGIIVHSPRTDTDYTLGVSLYGWFIEAPITDSEHIRHMKDDYWLYIAELSKIGMAELQDHGRSCNSVRELDPKPIRKLYQHKGSLVFSILRDYLFETYSNDHCTSVGGIQVTVPLDSDESSVRAFFLRGLELMYRANQLLHRSAHLQQQRFIKKFISKNQQ